MAIDYFENIDTLESKSAASSEADTAIDELEEAQVAVLINSAKQCGEYSAIWQHYLSDTLKSTLEGQGYTVEPVKGAVFPDRLWLIKW